MARRVGRYQVHPTLPALVSALSACAAIDPAAFVPHQSTAPQIDARMGVPAEVRQLAGGETIRFYPRFPWGARMPPASARTRASSRSSR
jgi:hypothetical protein